jgi:hypothetical protein
MKFFLRNKFYANIQGYKHDFGVKFLGDRLYPWPISKIIENILPCGRARDAHWPRYQGLAVAFVQRRP